MDKKSSFIINFIWKLLERSGAQIVAFVVSIILARMLLPEDFGMIAIVMVFTTILNVFVDSGLGNALIQKAGADDLDFSTVFFFNLAICCGLYVLMFFAAPFIADFFEDELYTSVIRALSLTVVISGVRNVQQAYVSRNMQFKKFFFATLGGTLLSAIVGITVAYMGYGVWALVWQQVTNVGIGTLILWFVVNWRPKLMFSFNRLKGLFSYGWKLLLSSLIDTVWKELWSFIIGKMYTAANLGFYNRGQQFPKVIVDNLNTSIDSVLFPVLSKAQDDPEQVKSMTRRAIKTSTYIMAPLLMGLAFIGTPVVRLILTEKWIECVPYMQIFCITYMFYPIHTANLNAIKAMGRSDLFLILEIIKKAVGLVALLSTMRISVMAMAYSLLFTSVAAQIINSWPNRKLLGYGYIEQMKDILPGIALAVFMGCCIWPIQLIGLSDALTICIQIPLGVALYIVLSVVFKMESFKYLWEIIKPASSKLLKKEKLRKEN